MDKKNIPSWITVPSYQNWLLSYEQCISKLDVLEQLAGPHIAWYTHKNPFSCWICDLLILCRRLQEITEEVLNGTESSLDLMTKSDGRKDCENK